MRQRPAALAAAAAFTIALAGCGDGDSTTTSDTTTSIETTTTTTRPTTTTEASPEDRFRQALSTQLDFGSASDLDAVVSAATTACDSLDRQAAGVTSDDAPNDTPETDTSIVAEMAEMTLGITFEPLDPQVAAVVAEAMGDYLCPDHREVLHSFAGDLVLK